MTRSRSLSQRYAARVGVKPDGLYRRVADHANFEANFEASRNEGGLLLTRIDPELRLRALKSALTRALKRNVAVAHVAAIYL